MCCRADEDVSEIDGGEMMDEEIKKYAIDIIADFNPYIAAIKTTFEKTCSISDKILIKKLMRLLSGQMNDMNSQIKLASYFQRESPKYYKNMQRLIYVINAINSDDKIDVISNLLRSLSMNLIDLKMFWRLVDIVDKMYYDDIVEFANLVSQKTSLGKYYNIFILQEYGLASCTNEFTIAAMEGNREYQITKIGLELVRCGCDSDHYDSYKEI